MSIWLVVLVAFVVALVGVATRVIRQISEDDVGRWLTRHDLDAGAEGRAFTRVYLSWVRPWRSAGLLFGIAPFVKWILYDRMDQASPLTAVWLGLTVIGYLGGCIIGEITFPAVSWGASGEAELKPRELSAFLAGPKTVMPWGVAVIAILLLPTYLMVADPVHVGGRLAGVIWASALVIVTAVSVRLALDRIVDRRRPVASSELLRVDHAARSSAIRTIVLAGIALELLLLSFVISEIARALEARPLHAPVSFLAAGVVGLAVLTWIGGASDRTPSSFVRRAGA